MKKITLLLALTVAGLLGFAQYNVPSQDMQEAKGLKAPGKATKAKSTVVNQNRAPGDVLHSFTFDTGLPTGWTSVDDAGIGGWEFYQDSARSAEYTIPELAMINSTSGGGYMHMPVEHYNCVPGSNPPVNNANLVDGDATITTGWLDVSGAPQVALTFASWFRHWYGNFDISIAIDQDESTWYTIDAHKINGVSIPFNEYPGPASYTPTPGDGNNAVFPVYNLTAAVGTSFNEVKISFRVHSTSHYFWSIDDVQLIEPNENEIALSEVYAGNFYIFTTAATYFGGQPGLYQGYNTNYSEVPGNIFHQLHLGGLLHQNGANGENARIDFAIDSVDVTDSWTATSTTSIPNYGSVTTGDTILYTDTASNYAAGPNFYNPELDQAWFETNDFYDDGIPYTFKYTAVTDNADNDPSNNFQIYEYAQTWGRYSYHWQPSLSANVNVNRSLSPFTYSLAKSQGDLFLNIFNCYQATDVDPADEFKIYGVRFFLPTDAHNTFDAVTGNGVEIKPIIYFWDSALQDWDVLVDAFAETTTLHESQLDTWVYLPFVNDGNEIDDYDFAGTSNQYRVGIYIEDYHNQEIALGVDDTYRQPFGHTVSWLDGTWRRLSVEGAVMIDIYTRPDQMDHDTHVGIKETPNNSTDKVKVYPNPTTGIIKITNAEESTINVYTLTGNLVKSVESNAVNTSVDLSEFARGTYLIKVIREKEIVTKKVNLLK